MATLLLIFIVWGVLIYKVASATEYSSTLIRRLSLAGVTLVPLAMMALGAHFLNSRNEAVVQSLIAEDTPTFNGSLRSERFAFLLHDFHTTAKPACGDFCLRMIISGLAQEFLVAQKPMNGRAMDTPMIAYRLVKRGRCPLLAPQDYTGDELHLKNAGEYSRRVAPADIMISLRAAGYCLEQRSAQLAEADLLLDASDTAHVRGADAFYRNAGRFVGRISLFRRSKSGFVETFRRTSVYYRSYFPLLLPISNVFCHRFGRLSCLNENLDFAGHFRSVNGGTPYGLQDLFENTVAQELAPELIELKTRI